MNKKLALPTTINLAQILATLKRAETALVGLALIGVFGYTAYVVQQAVNVKADAVTPKSRIVFDQKTLTELKSRSVVSGSTPLGTLGKDDPFGN